MKAVEYTFLVGVISKVGVISFLGYNNDKDLKVFFLMMHVT